MEITKHTQGPWKGKPLGFATFIYSDEQPNIAAVHGNDSAEGKANARLIAAATDLLEALREVVAISDRKHSAWDRAKSAIAKAEVTK